MSSADITKRAIADALKGLMAKKPLAKISVGDIVNACGINRNSFYYHFKDKYDLVNWIFYTDLTRSINQQDVLAAPVWTLVEGICTFFYADKAFYYNALLAEGQNSFSEYFTELMRTLVQARTEGIFENDEHQTFFATFYTDAFVSTIYRWLSTGAKMPPNELTRLMREASTGAAAAILDAENEAGTPST